MSEPTRDLPARLINRRGFAVSVLGFGGASIGNLYRPTGDDEATAAVDEAWAGGIRYYDTAPHYGLGLSERRLGEALRGKPRDEYVLSTKVGRLLVPNPAPTGSDLEAGGFAVHDDLLRQFDYSRDGVLRSLEGSLDRLGVERIDIVYVHDPENHMDDAIAHAFPALCDLRDQGVVKAIGAGMNHVAPLRRIVAEADVDVLMVAGRWTLLDRSAAPLLEECAARDVAVVDAAPFNSGLLARSWPTGGHFDYAEASAETVARAQQLAKLCADAGVELPAAAMQFPLRDPVVVSVVSGMRNATQVGESLARVTAPIPEELWQQLA
jgi:D-threo-aldose 1-dehydrogenase